MEGVSCSLADGFKVKSDSVIDAAEKIFTEVYSHKWKTIEAEIWITEDEHLRLEINLMLHFRAKDLKFLVYQK